MDELANVWPQNGLFAFSGVDGGTRHDEPFVASGTKTGIGWRFWLKPRLTLRACVGDVRLKALKAQDDYCLSDCWRCTVRVQDCQGLVTGAYIDHASMIVAIAFKSLPKGMSVCLGTVAQGQEQDGAIVYACEGCWLAVRETGTDTTRYYAIAVSYASADEALARAAAAAAADLPSVMKARMGFYESVTPPASLVAEMRRTYYKAVSIQKLNTESAQQDIPCRWTTPDRMPHRHMWLWDTAFHALGLQYTDASLARDALRALFAKQRGDGKLLLSAQPGQPAREEEDSQPPILAFALCHQVECSMHAEFVRELYPKMAGYLEWFEANRKDDTGLYGWRVRDKDDPVAAARGGESGMDNSPRFDSALSVTAVDLSSYMASEYGCMEKLARCIGAAADAEEWRARRLRIGELVNELLWDDEDRFYYDLDEVGDFISVKTTAGFIPLLGRIPDRDRAEALRTHLINPHEFWSPFPACSVSQDEDSYTNDMWRGPTWVNVNVLLYYGLMAYGFLPEARQLARMSMREIARCYLKYGCFYEYYDAESVLPPFDLPRKGAPGKQGGVGFGVVEDLHWTAASFVHFAHELG
ncbi:MAG: hypothetical protein GWP08_15520 [Nitrospiraceae bacterium]|nr:hypothetical protein [Nitrospiraceae bacterium]